MGVLGKMEQKEKKVMVELRVCQVYPDVQETAVQMVCQDIEDWMAKMEILVPVGNLEKPELLESLGNQVEWEQRERKGLMESRVEMELMAKMESQGDREI